ncbi:MAG: PQQ-binding-like beta-propeller repeat protein [Planctomycetota bacterium]
MIGRQFTWFGVLGMCALCAGGLAWAETSAEKPGPTVEALVRDLQNELPQVRIAAADALGRLGAEARSAVPALLAAAKGEQAWVDTAMLNAISALGAAALPALLDIFQNGDDALRLRAGRALWGLDALAPETLPIFKKALEDKDPKIKNMAERIVKKIEAENTASSAAAVKPAVPVAATPRTAAAAPAASRDWPQFHGPNRDSLCTETGLLSAWPDGGPQLLWKIEDAGRGLSTVSIAGGKLFTTGDRKREAQYVICYDLSSRKELWATRMGPPYKDYGAQCTPTVDGSAVYALGTEGDLVCLEAGTGAISWQKNLPKDFGGKMMNMWKFSESPLVDGEKLICTPGAQDAGLVALDKKTGALIWKCALPELGERGKDGAGYSSAVVAEIEGVRQYVQVLGRGVVGVAADSGKFLWGYNRLASEVANITHPLVRGNLVFTTNAYYTGSALLQIRRAGEAFKAEEVYFLPHKQFQNHHGGVVLLGDYVYGGSGQNKGDPACINFASGEVAWKAQTPSGGSAAVLYADGHLLFRYDRGLVVLVAADPKAFRIEARFTPPTADGPAWAHPVIHDKKLYLRHNDLLLCYDLSARN